jgi:hypothetical protein
VEFDSQPQQNVCRVGAIVTHPGKPEWGRGKVLDVNGDTLTIYFRDCPGENPRDAVKKIKLGYVTLELAELQTDWRLDGLTLESIRENPQKPRVTREQSIALFRRKFPLGFNDPAYMRDEYEYKWHAHKVFEGTFGDGKGLQLLNEHRTTDLKAGVRSVLNALKRESDDGQTMLIPMLAIYEQMGLFDGLADDRAAAGFFNGLFQLLRAPVLNGSIFQDYIDGVDDLPISGSGRATWPIATILPFLGDPTRFMFLKPDVTKQAAARFPFDLGYDAHPNWRTYDRLLLMSENLMKELRPLGARNWIDVQSFIWAVGDR